jgi:hypothetical protein
MAFGKMGARGGFGALGSSGGASPALPTFSAGVASTLGNLNQVMNPLMIGAVSGTPGTLPDFWTSDFTDVSKGITSQVVGSGVETGIPYIDVRFSGTATAGAAGRMQIVFQHFVEGGSQARANAVYLKLAAGSLTNCAVNTFVNTADVSNSPVSTLGFAAKTITGSALNTQKYAFTYTTDASAGFVDACMSVSYSVGSAFDVTVRIGLPQDERGATTHDLLISVPATDGFYGRTLATSFFGSHVESPGAGGEPFPFTNGPYTVLSRGKSFNPECRWNDTTNSSNGVYNFASIDTWINSLIAAGMTPVFTTFTGDTKPSWVTGTATAPNWASWQAWVTALIARYKTKIAIWEGINEVDGGVFYTDTKSNAVTQQQFLFNAVKAANSSAIVLGPSTTGSVTGMGYMRDLLVLGLGSYCDVFNYHSYNQSLSYTPEHNQACNMAHLAMYRRFYGGTAKPIWDTEGSYAHPPSISVANQIDFLIKQGVLALSSGSEHSIWYATDNATYGTLWTAGNGYNDSATALKMLRTWTNGAAPLGPATYTSGLWSMDFTRSGYTGRILWCTAGTTYAVPAGYVQYRDYAGQRFTVNTGDLIVITDIPILLETTNALGAALSGWILSPAQNGKTVWDTARDGSLPYGSYSAKKVLDGSQAIVTYMEDHFNNTGGSNVNLVGWAPDTLGSVAWSENSASTGHNAQVSFANDNVVWTSATASYYVNKTVLPNASYKITATISDNPATFSAPGILTGFNDTALTGYRIYHDGQSALGINVQRAVAGSFTTLLATIPDGAIWSTTPHSVSVVRYILSDRVRIKVQDNTRGGTHIIDDTSGSPCHGDKLSGHRRPADGRYR